MAGYFDLESILAEEEVSHHVVMSPEPSNNLALTILHVFAWSSRQAHSQPWDCTVCLTQCWFYAYLQCAHISSYPEQLLYAVFHNPRNIFKVLRHCLCNRTTEVIAVGWGLCAARQRTVWSWVHWPRPRNRSLMWWRQRAFLCFYKFRWLSLSCVKGPGCWNDDRWSIYFLFQLCDFRDVNSY